MNRYGFVVLNYNNFEDTIECVNSLLAISRDDYHIVVVDNASQNDSLSRISSAFAGNPRVDVLSSGSNRGYSGGNNIGLKFFADRNYKRVIIATNDTVLVSADILDRIDAMDLDRVAIVGPNVFSLDGEPQNPQIITPGILYVLNLFAYEFMHTIRKSIYRLFPIAESSRRKFVRKRTALASGIQDRSHADAAPGEVYMLHGCFYCLTEHFLELIGRLDENIFMFCEEDILSWECERKGLKRIFDPTITVIHKEKKSTAASHSNSSYAFVESNIRKSRKYQQRRIKLLPLIFYLLRFRLTAETKSSAK